MSQRLSIHPQNPQRRHVEEAARILKEGGVIIFATQTTYVFGCSINSKKGMQRIYQLKNIDKKKPLTFICNDTSQFQEYTKGIPTPIYRQIKTVLPGPYTFIFEASKKIPKVLLSPRDTIGVKIPNSQLCHDLVELMGEPILTSSVPLEEGETMQEGSLIFEKYHKLVDLVLDIGELFVTRSAIIDFHQEPPEIIREGDSDLSWLL